MKIARTWLLVICLTLVSVPVSAQGSGWRFNVGPSFVAGFIDVKNFYVDYVESRGYTIIGGDFAVPIGLSFGVTHEFAHGSRVSLDLGPMTMVMLSGGGDYTMFDFPVGLSYGFTFNPSGNTSPYARIGVRKHLVTGDLVKGSDVGLLAAFGVDFRRDKRIGFGLEVAYDTSVVTFSNATWNHPNATRDIKAGGIMVTAKAVFSKKR
jgi:hypothetical protein